MTGPFQTMPPLAADERDALERSIRTYGIEVPIVVDENGTVIDGHHRKEIAEYLGIECPVVVEGDLTDDQKVALSISLNIDRRQLTREQVRGIVAQRIKVTPEASNRTIARETGVHHETVQAIRKGLEESGEIRHFSERTDPRTGNATQAASKPRPAATEVSLAKPIEPWATGPDDEPVPLAEAESDGPASASWELPGWADPASEGHSWDVPGWAATPEPKPVEAKPVITPKPVKGLDGRDYQPTERAPRRGSIVDSARNTGWEIQKLAERLRRLQDDDRFGRNKAEIEAALRPHLDFAQEVLQDLETALTGETNS